MNYKKIKLFAAFKEKAQRVKEKICFNKTYVSERIVNIGELEDKLRKAHSLATLLKSKTEPLDSFVISCELVNILSDACEFEFEIERRKTKSI